MVISSAACLLPDCFFIATAYASVIGFRMSEAVTSDLTSEREVLNPLEFFIDRAIFHTKFCWLVAVAWVIQPATQ